MKKILTPLLALALASVAPLSAFAQGAAGKKIFFINAYHEGYPWSDGVTAGVESVIRPSGATLKIVRMDTKRNDSPEFAKAAAKKVLAEIADFAPDIIIAAEDNPSKYVIMPHFKNAATPVVFCGVNWDASMYGYPYKNATGMIEVNPLLELLDYLKRFSKGTRIGYLTSDVETERKEGECYKRILGATLNEETYVKTVSAWKSAYVKMQTNNDLLILGNNAGIPEWNEADVAAFMLKNAQIPSGCAYEWMVPYSLIGFTKIPSEQGEWAAHTALKILAGADPASIPIAKNVQGDLMINTKFAKKLGFQFPTSIVSLAKKVIE
jgi:ABC-type uncharacterized transport system substrate-binding protein